MARSPKGGAETCDPRQDGSDGGAVGEARAVAGDSEVRKRDPELPMENTLSISLAQRMLQVRLVVEALGGGILCRRRPRRVARCNSREGALKVSALVEVVEVWVLRRWMAL